MASLSAPISLLHDIWSVCQPLLLWRHAPASTNPTTEGQTLTSACTSESTSRSVPPRRCRTKGITLLSSCHLVLPTMRRSTGLLVSIFIAQCSGCTAKGFHGTTTSRNLGFTFDPTNAPHGSFPIGNTSPSLRKLRKTQQSALDTSLFIPRGGDLSTSLLAKIMKVHRFPVFFFGLQTMIRPTLSTMGMTSYTLSRAEILLIRMWGCFITFASYVIHIAAGWEDGSSLRIQIARALFCMYTVLTIINAAEMSNESVVENKQVNGIYLLIFAVFAAVYGIGIIYEWLVWIITSLRLNRKISDVHTSCLSRVGSSHRYTLWNLKKTWSFSLYHI